MSLFAQSQGRYEVMITMQKVIAGLGSAGINCYKDVYKASRNCMTDRAMTVRSAAAKVRAAFYMTSTAYVNADVTHMQVLNCRTAVLQSCKSCCCCFGGL